MINEINKKVGKEINSHEYWNQRSKSYSDKISGTYHNHRIEVIKALINNLNLNSTKCIDFGCGEGLILEYLASLGADVTGFDINQDLLNLANERILKNNLKAKVVIGGVNALSELKSDSVNCLLALNVLAYLTDDEEKLFYKEAQRIVIRGGG